MLILDPDDLLSRFRLPKRQVAMYTVPLEKFTGLEK